MATFKGKRNFHSWSDRFERRSEAADPLFRVECRFGHDLDPSARCRPRGRLAQLQGVVAALPATTWQNSARYANRCVSGSLPERRLSGNARRAHEGTVPVPPRGFRASL